MMLKRKGKTLLVLLFIIAAVTIYLQASVISNRNNNTAEAKTKEQEIAEEISLEEDKRLAEELLRSKIIAANNLVESVSKETQIILFSEKGTYKISHDRTPKNNGFTEWLNNADIVIKLKYRTVFAINTKSIVFNITPEGLVEASYYEDNIEIIAIDISNVLPVETVSIFGKKYTPVEIVALESIAKKEIQDVSYSKENILLASDNLKLFLSDMAISFGIDQINITSINK